MSARRTANQITALQNQLAALMAAVQVTPNGVVVQGPMVTLSGGTIRLQAPPPGSIEFNSGRLTAMTQDSINLRSGTTLDLLRAGPAPMCAPRRTLV